MVMNRMVERAARRMHDFGRALKVLLRLCAVPPGEAGHALIWGICWYVAHPGRL